MKKEIDLSIVILTYNSEDTIKVLLDSIKKSPDKLAKEIIIVDNNSQDNSYMVAEDHKLKPEVIKMKSNLGFPKGINQGIDHATGKYVLIINPDTKIIGDALNHMFSYAESCSNLGALAPRLMSPDGKPQPSVFHFPTITNAIKKYFFNCQGCYEKYLPSNEIQTVDVAVMAALLVPLAVFNSIGFLDERFFMYYEDIEFCRRLKQNRLSVIYFPQAKIMHLHGASGHFKSHKESPLFASARTYHGDFYFNVLNFVLWAGQKWQKLRSLIK